MKQGLSPKQAQLLNTIKQYEQKYGFSPAQEELAKIEGCSAANISRLVGILVERGYVVKGKGGRSLRTV